MISDEAERTHGTAWNRDALQSCFDFRVRSDIALPELIAADPSDRAPIVTIRLGEACADPRAPGALDLIGEDVARLTVPEVARFTISAGRDILVEPAPGVAERNVRLFLLGSALGILCHQRGLVPLHANAVVVDGRAYAFAGHSGAGKSTLAAHFAAAGLPVLSDDVVAVSLGAEGRAWAWPGVARVKLWRDASDALGRETAGLEPAADWLDKFHHPLARLPDAGAVPLHRLYLLEKADAERPAGITRVRGGDVLAALVAHTYRGAYLPMLGLSAQHFRRCAMLARSVEVYTAARRWGYDVFEAEAAALLTHIRTA